MISYLTKDEQEVVRMQKLLGRKKEKFVYYALKHPSIFIKVYEESDMDDISFCAEYGINLKVFGRIKSLSYREKKIRSMAEERRERYEKAKKPKSIF